MSAYSGSTEWTKPQFVEQDDSAGTQLWTDENYLVAGGIGGGNPRVFAALGEDLVVREAALYIGGAIQGTDKASDEDVTSDRTYGGSADDWGETLTGADVKADNFGFAVRYAELESGVDSSYYLIGYEFDFDIPDTATVDGIELRLTHDAFSAGGGMSGVDVEAIELKIHYTWEPKVIAIGSVNASVYAENPHPQIPFKTYAWEVYSSDRDYLGRWEVANSYPSIQSEINNLLGTVDVEMARNEEVISKIVEELLTEASENLQTEEGEDLLIDSVASQGLGSGTDFDLNHEVEISAYYGELVPLLTEDGEVLLTEDSEIIKVQDGAPDGKKLFTGYISKWGLKFGSGDNLRGTIFSHSNELYNIMLEAEDSVAESFTTWDESSVFGIQGNGPTDNTALAQSFQLSTDKTISRIRMRARHWGNSATEVPVTLTLRTGGTIGSGTVLGTAVAQPSDYQTIQPIDFIFDDYIDLTGSTTYHWTLEILDSGISKSGGGAVYPAEFAHNSSGGYASGSGYYQYGAGGSTFFTFGDFWFEIYQAGGNTKVPFNSYDPSNIVLYGLNHARARGSRVNFSTETIKPTYTEVSWTANVNSVGEVIEKAVELAPDGWFAFYDFGTNTVYFQPRPDEIDYYIVLGGNTAELDLERSLEDITNDIFFSGDSEANAFVRTTDNTSINTWRRGLKTKSDSRFSDTESMELVNQSEIDRLGNPRYSGSCYIINDEVFYIEDVQQGSLFGFIGFGTIVDSLSLQGVRLKYEGDKLGIDIDTLLPKVEKRVEDIKRNLAIEENKDNPDAPS